MNAHELIVFDKLESKGYSVFYPRRDRGVDCVVTSQELQGKFVKIQIKGSRKYEGGGGWFQVSRNQLETAKADIWIFIWPDILRPGKIEPMFLLIRPGELLHRALSVPGPGSNETLNLYFERREDQIIQTRGLRKKTSPEPARNFTAYLDNWQLVESLASVDVPK